MKIEKVIKTTQKVIKTFDKTSIHNTKLVSLVYEKICGDKNEKVQHWIYASDISIEYYRNLKNNLVKYFEFRNRNNKLNGSYELIDISFNFIPNCTQLIWDLD